MCSVNLMKVKTGDVFKYNDRSIKFKAVVTKIEIYTDYFGTSGRVCVVYENGSVDSVDPVHFSENWHKIGHVDGFGGILKEIRRMEEK